MSEENQNEDKEAELHESLWGAQVAFARAVMALHCVLDFDDIDQQILEELHEKVNEAEQAYHKAFFECLEYQDAQELEAAPVAGTA